MGRFSEFRQVTGKSYEFAAMLFHDVADFRHIVFQFLAFFEKIVLDVAAQDECELSRNGWAFFQCESNPVFPGNQCEGTVSLQPQIIRIKNVREWFAIRLEGKIAGSVGTDRIKFFSVAEQNIFHVGSGNLACNTVFLRQPGENERQHEQQRNQRNLLHFNLSVSII